ncbi:hypothetical protein CS063_02435 [Sporanaerobium hydrogeniformans]|uniref:Uncharacterized protein n=1 Tax=Sporanaerobium hydrogeniformans TaxID=3072179 RepID=A0AC61DHT3_9FIRM|nr:stage III sporulation protein AB [Sporanaerobium hydrogeniformans]PHV72355.1 hypothetical protein CS063_02435 [Sporanaerobium hydrogeniformans]
MRLVGIGIVFISCTLAGFVLDSYERKRLTELEQFVYIFELLRAEIEYRLTPLEEACYVMTQFASFAIGKVWEDFANLLKGKQSVNVTQMWEEALMGSKIYFHLKDKDYEILESFGKACGYLDKNMQSRNIDMLIVRLKEELEKAKVQYEKQGKLNRSLGILVGACLSLFLI